MRAIALLATQLRIAPALIHVTEVARADWPDSCLGLPADGEICASVITPGFALRLAVADQQYEFRTDESGQRIRLASAPPVEPGEPLLTWRDSTSFLFLVIGSERVSLGMRGRPLLGLPPPLPERMAELEHFLGRFAPFQEQTPAGDTGLRSRGTTAASPAEQRMIAEWARLVAAEANQGLSAPAPDRALIWHRSGGDADSFDTIVVGRAGAATALSRRGGEERKVDRVMLEHQELEQLYRWLDRLEPFNSDFVDNSAGTAVSLELRSTGIEAAGANDRDAMIGFIAGLVNRFRSQNAGN